MDVLETTANNDMLLENDFKNLINQYPTIESNKKTIVSVWRRSLIRQNLLRNYDILPTHIINAAINEFIQNINNTYLLQTAGIKRKNRKTKRKKTKRKIQKNRRKSRR
jgi:hypothetical protein